MRRKRAWILAMGLVMGLPATVWAHEPHICPEGIVDLPGLRGATHTEQSLLLAGTLTSSQLFLRGGAWGDSRFNECDGQGRPATTGGSDKRLPGQPSMHRVSGPEGTSCAGCHAQPRPGGAGDFVANTFNGAELLDPVTDSVSPDTSNERNTTGMFGAGYLELIAREMTRDLKRQAARIGQDGWHTLTTKGIEFDIRMEGRRVVEARGIDTDLIVRPFGAGGTKVSIREFTVGALNRHHGLQPEEAFDLYLGDPDYDEDGIVREMTVGDLTVTALWQAMLDRPLRELPDDAAERAAVQLGEQQFEAVGCASCHVAEIVLNDRTFCEPNPYNPPGIFADTSQSVCVVLNYDDDDPTKTDSTDRSDSDSPPPNRPLPLAPYTDLKRHAMCDPEGEPDAIRALCNERHAEGRPVQDGIPGQEFFLTADLWQVGESAPYGHDGRYNSLSSVILAHAGEARVSRDNFAALPAEEQLAILKFLKTLKIRDQPIRIGDG